MVRTLLPGDAVRVKYLCETALGHQTDAALIRRRISELAGDACYYLVAYEDAAGVVQGFLQAQRYDLLYGAKGWNVIALASAPEARGRGVGRALMEALENHALQTGGSFVRLNSNVMRPEAHAFYEHLGYQCDKTQKRVIKYLAE